MDDRGGCIGWGTGNDDSGASVDCLFGIPEFIGPVGRFSLVPGEGQALLKCVFYVVDVEGVDGGSNLVVFVVPKFVGNVLFCLLGVGDDLSPDSVEGLKEVLGVEVLGGCEQSVDVSRNDIEERIHPIFVVEAQFLFIGLHLSEDFLLLRVKKPVNEVECLVPCLDHHLLRMLLLVPDFFDQDILRGGNITILDFWCSRAEMRARRASCMLE